MNLNELSRRLTDFRGKPLKTSDQKYLKFIRSQPCVITGVTGTLDAHHVLLKSQRREPLDYLTVPLRHDLHMELHNSGVQTFEQKYCICLQACAVALFIKYVMDVN